MPELQDVYCIDPDVTWARHARLQALVVAVDAVAIACERKWGIGRLECLVSKELRDRFLRQRDKLDAAIAGQDIVAVERHAAAMRRGWEMLDRAATHGRGAPIGTGEGAHDCP